MFAALLPLICGLLLTPQQAQVEPFIPVGLWYAGHGAQPPATAVADLEAARAELAAIRRAGFNSITTWINWRDAEPKRGTYALAAIERLIAAAAQSDLRVDVRVFADKPPEWSSSVQADRARFVSYALARLRLLPQVTSVEAADDRGDLGKAIRVGRNGRTPIEARMDFWAAMSRGAQRVTFLDAEGGAGPSVLSLGETVGIVTRNQALFAPLRARAGGIRDVVGRQRRAGGCEAARKPPGPRDRRGQLLAERPEGDDQLHARHSRGHLAESRDQHLGELRDGAQTARSWSTRSRRATRWC